MVKHVCFEFLIQFIEKNNCHITQIIFSLFLNKEMDDFFVKNYQKQWWVDLKKHPKDDKVICESFLT